MPSQYLKDYIVNLPLKKFSVSVSCVPMMAVVSPQIMSRTRTPDSAFFLSSSPNVKPDRSISSWVFRSVQSSPLKEKGTELDCPGNYISHLGLESRKLLSAMSIVSILILFSPTLVSSSFMNSMKNFWPLRFDSPGFNVRIYIYVYTG